MRMAAESYYHGGKCNNHGAKNYFHGVKITNHDEILISSAPPRLLAAIHRG